jgi:AraC family transcriptional activator of pobA
VHPNYLNALIKKNTGLTAKESIQNRLLLESKYLLHSTDLTIKEISNQMGFTDPNYFAVFFKKYENTSPTSYRGSFV